MSACMTKSNKFEYLEIKLPRFSFFSIISWKSGTLKDTMIGFKLEAKRQSLRDTKNWDLKPKRYDEHSYHPTILPSYHIRLPSARLFAQGRQSNPV